jgi:hypothetical protein
MVLHVIAHARKSRAERPEYVAPVVREQIPRKPREFAQDAIGRAVNVLISRREVTGVHEPRRRVPFIVLSH